MRPAIDITGQRFGKLVAVERADVTINKVRWRCQCDCGNTAIVFGTMLRNGHTTSCGCNRGIRGGKVTKRRLTLDEAFAEIRAKRA